MRRRLESLSRIVLLAMCFAGQFSSARAQDVYVPGNTAIRPPVDNAKPLSVSAAIAPLPPAEGESDPAESIRTSAAALRIANEVSAVERRFQYGFRLAMRGVYDDNIFLTENNHVADFYFTIEPGLTLGFGDIVGSDQNFVRLDYAPSAIIYADHSSANGIQHVIRLSGQYHFRRLAVSLSQDIQLLEGANLNSIGSTGPNPVPGVRLDAGGDIGVNIFTTNGGFAYDLTGKTFLSGGVQHVAYDYESDLISSETASGNLFINYNFSPKLVIGLGGTFGYNWVDAPSPDQMYEQINGRVTYQASGKISLNASGGVEFRQFEDEDSGSHISPVYELGASYQPFDGTSISLSGNRRTQNSAVSAGQDYVSTNITISARQRFFQRIYLGLAVGFENSSYFNTVEGVDASREDNYFFFQPAIDVTLTRFWTAGAYYLHRENDSSSSLGFDDDQLGLRTSLTF